MTLTFDTPDFGDGFGYRVYAGGVLWVDQPFQPGSAGFNRFVTSEDAAAAAQALIDELSAQEPLE